MLLPQPLVLEVALAAVLMFALALALVRRPIRRHGPSSEKVRPRGGCVARTDLADGSLHASERPAMVAAGLAAAAGRR